MLHIQDLKRSTPRASKYGNKPDVVDGHKFDSQAEARRYSELALLQKAGLIQGLKRQVSFELAPRVRFKEAARSQPPLRYVADFTYLEAGRLVIEDVKSKGTVTALFKVKRHLMLSVLGHQITVQCCS